MLLKGVCLLAKKKKLSGIFGFNMMRECDLNIEFKIWSKRASDLNARQKLTF